MENYKQRLEEQKEAIQADINLMINNLKTLEDEAEVIKERKRVAFRELKSIEKKLQKL